MIQRVSVSSRSCKWKVNPEYENLLKSCALSVYLAQLILVLALMEMATHQNSCLENPMERGQRQTTVHGVTRVGQDLVTKLPPPLMQPIWKMVWLYLGISEHIHSLWTISSTPGYILNNKCIYMFTKQQKNVDSTIIWNILKL